MNLKDLTRDQFRSYYEGRLDAQAFRQNGAQTMALCLFHPDRNPSMALDFDAGTWHCHACKFGGGVLDMELKLGAKDSQEAVENIAELIGDTSLLKFSGATNTIYDYVDEYGKLLFQVVRQKTPDGRKTFKQRRPDGKGGWDYRLGNVRKPLYHLDEVIVAREVVFCEGEKDVDRVRKELGDQLGATAVTTNCGGAGKWLEENSKYFAGKRVVILPDNDDIGRKHSQRIAAAISPYACAVKVVELPGLPEKGDVSNFLDSGTLAELGRLIKNTPVWTPSEDAGNEQPLLISAIDFMRSSPQDIEWLVEGLVQVGANGFFTAPPKGGKSWATLDLALSLALGQPWLGFNVTRRVRTALVTREDNPALTSWRMRNLLKGKGAQMEELDDYLYVNSRAQSKTLMLDNEDELAELMAAIKARKIQFLFLDVFNVLHAADENSNTEMRQVMNRVASIQAETGAVWCLVHHNNKFSDENTSLTQKLRGASAIAGAAEYVMGITPPKRGDNTRCLEAELKASSPPDPVYYQIESNEREQWAKQVRVATPSRPRAMESAEEILA